MLGDETRLGSAMLPVDRWMLDRLDATGTRRGRELPPVAWQGRFTTSSLLEPDNTAPTAAPVPAARVFDAYADVVATIPEPETPMMPEPEPEHEVRTASPPLPAHSPWPQATGEGLDPEVRALIDELYEDARAEISGESVGFFAPVDEDRVNGSSVNERLVDEVVAQPPPEAPATPNASAPKRQGRAKTGWVAAIQTSDLPQGRHRHHG